MPAEISTLDGGLSTWILLIEDQLALAGDSQLVGLTRVLDPYHLAPLQDIAGFPDRGLSGGRYLISSWFSISSRGVFTISHCFVPSNRQVPLAGATEPAGKKLAATPSSEQDDHPFGQEQIASH